MEPRLNLQQMEVMEFEHMRCYGFVRPSVCLSHVLYQNAEHLVTYFYAPISTIVSGVL